MNAYRLYTIAYLAILVGIIYLILFQRVNPIPSIVAMVIIAMLFDRLRSNAKKR